ncbi:MAG: class I SAM-dependent methyltransferase [Nitrososphaerales archaeon]|nr:class I SAM-dependent methyltransferase [Nitrososphaerales archaeon]
MESFPEWAGEFYRLYSTPYAPGSEAATTRVEQGLPHILKHLPKKGSSVLDLCCGAGVYLFPLEKAGYRMTGLDIQGRMVRAARQYAKKHGSKASILKGDATRLKFGASAFDAVVFLGAPFGHFGLVDFQQIARETFRVLRSGGVMVAEVNDHVAMMMAGVYQRILYEPSGEKDVVSIHTRYDPEKGTFNRLFVDFGSKRRFKGSFRIWTPWILEFIMANVGFRLTASEQGSFGLYTRFQAYRKP